MPRFHLLAVAAATVLPTALASQGTARDSTSLPRIVITADRVPVPVERVTSTVTVLDAARLRASGVTHVLEALRQVPGLAVVRSGSFGSQASLFARGGESDYTRVLVDGVPMNEPGGAVDLGTFTLDDVERIEVVRGPSSVVHGSDAMSAVVHIITRRPGTGAFGHLSAGGGSYGSTAIDAGTSASLGSLGVAAAVARHASDGILPFNNAYRNTTASARAVLRGATPVSLALRRSGNDFHYPTDGAGAVVDRNAMRDERRTAVSVEGQRAFGRLTARLTGAWLDLGAHTDDASDGPADTLGFHAYRSRGSVRRREVGTSLQWQVAGAHTLAVGGEYAGEWQRQADSSNYDLQPNRFAADRITRAGWAQLVGAAGRASYSLGARVDRNDVFGTFRTARVAGAWSLREGTRVRAAAGNAFKAPTFLEQFSTAFSVGNPALVPERNRGWEAGIEHRAGRATLAATWFAQRFRDLIQYTYRSPTDPSYFNVAAARASGLELEGSAAVGVSASLRGAATFLRTRVDDAGFDTGAGATFVRGARLLRRPARVLSLGGTARVTGRTTLDLQASRVGARDDRDFGTFPAKAIVLPAYTRVDLSTQVRLSRDGARAPVSLLLRADNVLGAGYEEVLHFRAPGRVLFAGLRADWGR